MPHPADVCPGGLQGECGQPGITCVLGVIWDMTASSLSSLGMESWGTPVSKQVQCEAPGIVKIIPSHGCVGLSQDGSRDAHLGS